MPWWKVYFHPLIKLCQTCQHCNLIWHEAGPFTVRGQGCLAQCYTQHLTSGAFLILGKSFSKNITDNNTCFCFPETPIRKQVVPTSLYDVKPGKHLFINLYFTTDLVETTSKYLHMLNIGGIRITGMPTCPHSGAFVWSFRLVTPGPCRIMEIQTLHTHFPFLSVTHTCTQRQRSSELLVLSVTALSPSPIAFLSPGLSSVGAHSLWAFTLQVVLQMLAAVNDAHGQVNICYQTECKHLNYVLKSKMVPCRC